MPKLSRQYLRTSTRVCVRPRCHHAKPIKSVARPQAHLLLTLVLLTRVSWAQLTTGLVEGSLLTPDRHALSGASITASSGAGFEAVIYTNPAGGFTMILPYGWYRLSVTYQQNSRSVGPTVFIAPLQTTRIDLLMDASGVLRLSDWPRALRIPGLWPDSAGSRVYPEAFSLQGVLASREPTTVSEPLNFTGLADNRLGIVSQRGFSWTDTQFKLAGLDATDSYQPGYPLILPDAQAFSEVVLRTAFALTSSNNGSTEIELYPNQPGTSWHGAISSANTGSGLAFTNLPQPADRGLVQQAERYVWFTRDRFEIDGPLTRGADFFASLAGQWAAQAMPLASPGVQQSSRILYGNAGSRIRAGAHNQVDLLYSGSRLGLSNGGVPAGMEVLAGRRMSPEFNLPYGFLNEAEADDFNFLQAGWTHSFAASPGAGVLQVRYGFSIAHLNTRPVSQVVPEQSHVELFGSAISGAPPLENLAIRTRQEIAAAWEPDVLRGRVAATRLLRAADGRFRPFRIVSVCLRIST